MMDMKDGGSDLNVFQSSQGAMTFYRPDLHSELKRLCLLQSSEFKAPKLLLGSEVVSVVSLHSQTARKNQNSYVQDIEKATVTLANGSSLSGDLIIGADGERVSTPGLCKPLSSTKANSATVNHKSSIQRSRYAASSTLPHFPRHRTDGNARHG